TGVQTCALPIWEPTSCLAPAVPYTPLPGLLDPPPDDTPPLAPPTFLRNWDIFSVGSGLRPRGTATSLCPRTREVDRPNSLMSALHSFAYSLIWWAGHESSPVASASMPMAWELL